MRHVVDDIAGSLIGPAGDCMENIIRGARKIQIEDCQRRIVEARHEGFEDDAVHEEAVLASLVAQLLED